MGLSTQAPGACHIGSGVAAAPCQWQWRFRSSGLPAYSYTALGRSPLIKCTGRHIPGLGKKCLQGPDPSTGVEKLQQKIESADPEKRPASAQPEGESADKDLARVTGSKNSDKNRIDRTLREEFQEGENASKDLADALG